MKRPRKKILVIFGTRPEAIKMCPLVIGLREARLFDVKVCVTGQHRAMLDQVMESFSLKPDFDLKVMQPSQTLGSLTSKILEAVDELLAAELPDLVLVHGDTTTAFTSALCSFYRHIKVGHVEAGLRTHQLGEPFPEEFNRQIVGKLASIHFAPTIGSAGNLRKEGVSDEQIFITGNTVIDALQLTISRITDDIQLRSNIESDLNEACKFDVNKERYVLVTGHRRENFGAGFENICAALREIALTNPGSNIVYPVHLNPLVVEPVNRLLNGIENIKLIPPLPYQHFTWLLSKCFFVLTDSGGIQEEAPGLGKPVLVMRNSTERPEAVEAGTVRLVGADTKRIILAADELLSDALTYEAMSKAQNPYGDGRACGRIIDVLNKALN